MHRRLLSLFLTKKTIQELLDLLNWAQLAGVTKLLLATVGCAKREAGVALAANLLVAVKLAGKNLQRRFDDATTQTQDQMQGRFLLNVVIRQRAAIFKLLASKDQALLVRGDALFVLDLGLDIVDRVAGLDVKGNCLASEGLDENLHG